VHDALEGVDVLVDYTSAAAVKPNTLEAIERRVAVVIGSSVTSAADFEEIDAAARARGVGVVASGNFSITAAMCQAAALLAARHPAHWKIIDYASATKPDVPSGTSRELAERLE
jgi:4-hydroxy-tetrahydrodipicolinate reductase